MNEYPTLSVVALLEDLPAVGLVRGQVGTIVEKWATDQLMRLIMSLFTKLLSPPAGTEATSPSSTSLHSEIKGRITKEPAPIGMAWVN